MFKKFGIVTTLALVGVVFMFGTVSSAHAVTIDLYAVSDAEITNRTTGSDVNTHNWGSLTNLVGNVNRTGGPQSTSSTSPLYFPNTGESRGLFLFDLSSIPVGATINSATVYLYVNGNAFSPVTSRITSVSLYQVTSGWTEMGVTYDTHPTWNTSQVTSMSIPAGTGSGGSIPYNGYISGGGINIKNLVQAWVDGASGNYGLVTSDTYTTAGLLRISAHEATGTSTDPYLRVDYTYTPPPPVPIPPSVLLFGTGLLGLVGAGGRRFFKK